MDPFPESPWGEHSVIVASVDEMIKKANDPNSPPYLLVVDEGTLSLDKFDTDQYWLTKSSRHYGHATIIIGHNWTDIAKQIRTQCTQIFILGCSRTDARDLIDEFNDDSIGEAMDLEIGHFVRILMGVGKENKVSFGHIDFDGQKLVIDKTDKKEKSVDIGKRKR